METGEQGVAKEEQEKVVAPTAVLRALVHSIPIGLLSYQQLP